MSGLRHLGPSLARLALVGLVVLAFAALASAPAQAQTVTTLVSNTGEDVSSFGTSRIVAQSFRTGANGNGYEISEIQIFISSVPNDLPDNSVKLRIDDGGAPGNLVADLTDPASFSVANNRNTFTVPDGTILNPETTYWVVVNEGIESASDRRITYSITDDNGQTGEDGWSIGDGYLWKSSPAFSWQTSANSLFFAVRGRVFLPIDAPLSEIVVNIKSESGIDAIGDEIALGPAFSSDRTSYSLVVGHGSVSYVTVRTTQPGATVRFFVTWMSHLSGHPPAHFEVEEVLSLGDRRWRIYFPAFEGRYMVTVSVTSPDEDHQVNYELNILARGLPPNLLWALIAPHGSSGTLDRVTMKYDKILRPDGPDPANPLAPPASAFSVEVEDQPVGVRSTQINAEYLQLSLARELSPQEQQVTLSYTRPATNPVQTNIGGLAADLTDYPVDVSRVATTNNSKLSVADAEATEGDDATMDFVVTLEPGSWPGPSVSYATADGSATAGEDYKTTSGRVKFKAFETTKTISVPIIDDTEEDDGQTFTLILSDPFGAPIADGEATGTIRNTEEPPTPDPLTATITDMPSEHTGEAFTFGLGFSEEPQLSYETLRDDAFAVTGGSVTNASRTAPPSNQEWNITVEPDSDDAVTITLPKTTDCSATGAICTGGDDPKRLSNSPSATVVAAVPENSPATSAPTISGTAQVGETLTADTSGIADADGLNNAAFAYQWLADDSEIAGATGSTYTLTADDEGKSVKVRVTFTDDADNEESLTSAATAVVAAAPEEQIAPLTASVSQVPDFHDGSAAFTFELRFSEEPADGFSYRRLRDHAFTVTGGEVTKARRLEAGKNIRWEITVQPSGNGDVTVVLPATTDCDAEGAICTEDGRMLAVSVELSVNGP